MTKRFAFALALGITSTFGCTQSVGEPTASTSQALTPVTWTSTVGANAVGSDLTKTGISSLWDSGAVSNETLSGDGFLEVTTGEANTGKMAGLSNGNTNAYYTDIDFAFYLKDDGSVRVYEAGAWKGNFGTYVAGDTFRVQVVGGVVSYLQNGSTLYESAGTPTFPLLADTSLYTPGATIQDAAFDTITTSSWQNAVGVTPSGSSLTKTAAVGWTNSGASTLASINTDGYTEFTTGETTTAKMAGLSNGDTDAYYADIDYAFYLKDGALLRVYEKGVWRMNVGNYAAGDVLRIAVANGAVSYYQNGTLVYVSSVAATFPLLVDTSLYTTGATVQNVVLAETYWQNAAGVTKSGQNLTKVGANAWNAGASTAASLSGDGYTEFTTAESNTSKMAGLSNGDSDKTYVDIDYAIYLKDDGNVRVYEKGTWKANTGTYVAGDVFRVQVTGSVVTYLKNGTLMYTSSVAPTSPLLADTSLFTTGATLQSVVLSSGPQFWQNDAFVTKSGNGLTKSGAVGWNAGASTTASISTDGQCDFSTAEANTSKMAGLSNGDSDRMYGDIDYAIYLKDDGNVRIYEKGVWKANVGTYVAGDVFSVKVTGSVVTYLKNGTLLYTSAAAPTFPLLVDTSLYTDTATIQGVSIL
jgi:hypothetical protein